MNQGILLHHHKHGTDFYPFQTAKPDISEEEVVEKLDINFEPEEGEEVELEIKKNIVKRTYGLIKLDTKTIDEIIEDTKYGSQ